MNMDYDNFERAFESLMRQTIAVDEAFQNIFCDDKTQYNIDLHNLWIKGIMHSYTLKQIIDGTKTVLTNGKIYDYSSAYVIARCLYECVLTMHYIYFQYENEDEKTFKYLCWYYSGFLERQKFTPIVEETKIKKEKEMKIVEEYKEKILTSNHYKTLTEKEKKQINKIIIKKGEWRLEPWAVIGKKIGLSQHIRYDVYKLLCGYAHSGRNSIFQIAHSGHSNSWVEQMHIPNTILCISIARLIEAMYRWIAKTNAPHKVEISAEDKEYYEFFLSMGKKSYSEYIT